MEKTLFSQDYQVLLELLREVRERTGVTQIQIATRLETTQSIVSKSERGERRLDVLELRRWCIGLGVPFADFMVEFELALAKGKKRQ
ncbi:MAG: helix-turn-helix transcriptional regulator [Holophaga sp.]|nr:helix-turn-helix transcriptional regulator [Holophaga sp.]